MDIPADHVNAGYFVGHPAEPMPELPAEVREQLRELATARRFRRPRTFVDLEAAAQIAGPVRASIHGLWLAEAEAADLRDDERDARRSDRRWQLVRCAAAPRVCQPIRGGHDVLGPFGGEFLAWNRERTGRAAARRLGIDAGVEFLPDSASAEALADLLNQDELGSPVVWRVWWRSLHECAPGHQ
jgi:hypothetical protein